MKRNTKGLARKTSRHLLRAMGHPEWVAPDPSSARPRIGTRPVHPPAFLRTLPRPISPLVQLPEVGFPELARRLYPAIRHRRRSSGRTGLRCSRMSPWWWRGLRGTGRPGHMRPQPRLLGHLSATWYGESVEGGNREN
jgi:hypothetical protein